MKDVKQPSTIEIIAKGYFWVNIPTVIIILTIWIILLHYSNFNYVLSCLTATSLGWIYWAKSIKKWIIWAHSKNIDKKKILQIGRITLLLWNESTIENALITKEK